MGKKRYVNLQQCDYNASTTDNFPNVMPNITNPSGAFNTGTNVGNTAVTSPTCGAGGSGYVVAATNSGAVALDLLGHRYINLQQCSYAGGIDDYPNILPNTPNTPFNTGTNVANTAAASLTCGPGAGS